MVATGEVDAAAVDSQVLAIELRDHQALAAELRVIEVLGPSTIQPAVAARHLPVHLKDALRTALLRIGDVTATRAELERGFIDRFVEVSDDVHDDARGMLLAGENAGFITLA